MFEIIVVEWQYLVLVAENTVSEKITTVVLGTRALAFGLFRVSGQTKAMVMQEISCTNCQSEVNREGGGGGGWGYTHRGMLPKYQK